MFTEQPRVVADHASAAGALAKQVRGTLLVSSLQALRDLGHYSRYIVHLPQRYHDAVLFALAPSWLPTDVLMAHYEACDAMGLDDQEMSAAVEHVAARIVGTFVGTAIRGVRAPGSNGMLVLLPKLPHIWDRLIQGGGVRATMTGPKDAIIEARGVPMFRYRYFRAGYVNMVRNAGMLLCKTCHIHPQRSTDTGMTITASWV